MLCLPTSYAGERDRRAKEVQYQLARELLQAKRQDKIMQTVHANNPEA